MCHTSGLVCHLLHVTCHNTSGIPEILGGTSLTRSLFPTPIKVTPRGQVHKHTNTQKPNTNFIEGLESVKLLSV